MSKPCDLVKAVRIICNVRKNFANFHDWTNKDKTKYRLKLSGIYATKRQIEAIERLPNVKYARNHQGNFMRKNYDGLCVYTTGKPADIIIKNLPELNPIIDIK